MEKEEEIQNIEEKENMLQILHEAKSAVKKEDIIKLKDLSNRTIHTASIKQDADSVTIAVIIYSLSKVIERRKYTYYEEWPEFSKNYMENIDKAISALEKSDLNRFRNHLNDIRQSINNLSGRFKKYIQNVFRKAQINKASRIYEHGISMEQTAGLLGITLWELAEYAGQTGISDVNLTVTLPIKQRIKLAEDIFK